MYWKFTTRFFLFLVSISFSLASYGENYTKLWEYEVEEGFQSAFHISNEQIYFESNDKLFSLSLDGELLSEIPFIGSVTFNNSGDLYSFTSTSMARYNPSGDIEWTKEVPSRISNTFLGRDGSFYFNNAEGLIYKISSNGDVLWQRRFFSEEKDYSSITEHDAEILVVGDDETLYLITKFEVIAVSPDGYERWRATINTPSNSPVSGFSEKFRGAFINGLLHITSHHSSYNADVSEDNYYILRVINASGEYVWGSNSGYSCRSYYTPVVVSDSAGNTIVKTGEEIYKRNNNGDLLWNTDFNGYRWDNCPEKYGLPKIEFSTPVVNQNGQILVTKNDGLYLFESSGEFKQVYQLPESENDSLVTPILLDDGRVLLRSGNKIIAVQSDSSLANSDWPFFAQNYIYSYSAKPSAELDTDNDGIPDSIDPDNDNDGVLDENDSNPQNELIAIDSDNDGIDDSIDNDDDNDGVIDTLDEFPLDASKGTIVGIDTFRWKNMLSNIPDFPTREEMNFIYGEYDFLYLSNDTLLIHGSDDLFSVDMDSWSLNWKIKTPYKTNSVKVSHDNIALLSKPYPSDPGHSVIQLISHDGELKIEKTDEYYDDSEISIASGNTLFVRKNNELLVLNEHLDEQWRYSFSSNISTFSPSVMFDGSLIVTGEQQLFKLSAEGELIWQRELAEIVKAQPIIRNDSVVVLAQPSGISALNPVTGKNVWKYDFEYQREYIRDLVTDEKNNLYVSACRAKYWCELFAISSTGSALWAKEFQPNGSLSAPAISSDGSIYLFASAHTIEDIGFSTPLDAHYFDRWLITLEPDGELRNTIELSSFIRRGEGAYPSPFSNQSPMLFDSGYILAPTTDTNIQAYNTNGTGLLKSSWPVSQGNLQGTSEASLDGFSGAKVPLRNTETGEWKVSYLANRYELLSTEMSFASHPNWAFQRFTDINGDGVNDVLLRHKTSGSWYAYLLSNDAIIDRGYMYLDKGADWSLADFGDFNGDGKPEALLRNDASRNDAGNWKLYTLKGRKIVSTSEPAMSTFSGWKYQAVGDFNGDGHDDVLIRNAASGQWYAYLFNDGEIVSRGYLNLALENTWQLQQSADIDIDGKSDLLLRNTETGGWQIVYLNGRKVKSQSSPEMTRGQTWKLVNIHDYDQDGYQDILLQSEISGRFYQYFLTEPGMHLRGYAAMQYEQKWQVPKQSAH